MYQPNQRYQNSIYGFEIFHKKLKVCQKLEKRKGPMKVLSWAVSVLPLIRALPVEQHGAAQALLEEATSPPEAALEASLLAEAKDADIEDGHAGAGVPVPPPFPLLPGEGVIYEVSSTMDSLPDTFFPDSLPRLSCTELDFPELSS